MTGEPFFSVVIPTYNRAELIVKTLETVFRQSYKNFEVIVVDNCSTDNTDQVLKPFIESGKIVFIKHDRNYERAESRNTGMAAASGQFLTLLDSDDLMYENNLKDAHAYIQQNPDMHFFHNLYELVNEKGEPIYHYPFPSLRNPIKAIVKGNFISCIGVFMSEKVYEKYKFDTSIILQGIEDWELWLRILTEFKLGRIKKLNSGIVHHKGRSINQYELSAFIQKKDYVLEKMSFDSQLRTIYGPYKNEFGSSCYLLAASIANGAGLYTESKVYLRAAFQINKRLLLRRRFWRILQVAFWKSKSKI